MYMVKDVIAQEERLKQIEDSTKLISQSVVPTMIKSSLKRLTPCARNVGYVHGKRRHCEGGTTEANRRFNGVNLSKCSSNHDKK